MTLKPVRKRSLSDAVFEQLRDEIISGRMEPGSTLPAERVLCEMLNVNRGAVREALKRLEQARLVSVQHGGSTTVLNYRETAGTDLLAALLITPDGQVNTRVARSVMEMRSALGSDIARLCAQRGQAAAPSLHDLVDKMQTEAPDLESLQALSMMFWGLLVENCGNVAYQLAFNSLRETYAKFSELLTSILADEWNDLAAYRGIADAVEAQDPTGAQLYARQLVTLGEQRIVELIEALDAVNDDAGDSPGSQS